MSRKTDPTPMISAQRREAPTDVAEPSHHDALGRAHGRRATRQRILRHDDDHG